MGSDFHFAEESPAREVSVGGFWIDRYQVTNADFAGFVAATGYMTLAERKPGPVRDIGAEPANGWGCVPGANWRQPAGPDTTIRGLADHPVVHIAYEDAQAFAAWAGKQLPMEAEWEFAARGGLEEKEFAWGDEFTPNGEFMANTWQGPFPFEDRALDGFAGTSPVGSFPANGYGLYDMIGNVWEWTRDWYARYSRDSRSAANDPNRNATGPASKVIKGASYLCSPSHCQRYRPAARMAQPVDTPMRDLGFRCLIRT